MTTAMMATTATATAAQPIDRVASAATVLVIVLVLYTLYGVCALYFYNGRLFACVRALALECVFARCLYDIVNFLRKDVRPN